MTTIKDVAREAGVSIKTVSRVINEEPYVTEEMRAKVQAAVRKVGYAPNISARRLARNKSFMIGILMYPGFYQPASEVFSRIMEVGYEEDYDILIQPYFPPHNRSKKKLVSLIYEHRVDGFVTTPPLDGDDFVADMLNTYKMPQVQINPLRRDTDIPFVAGNDLQGAEAITDYLIGLGHRRIAFLSGPRNLRSAADRMKGYQSALNKHGVVCDDCLVHASEWTFDGGLTVARELLGHSSASTRPTAIFAGSDEAAYGVLYAAQELGIKVPDGLSVCGYDDLGFSRSIWPGLTTVHQPAEELIERATRALIALLKGERIANPAEIIPAQLVVRASTGIVPG